MQWFICKALQNPLGRLHTVKHLLRGYLLLNFDEKLILGPRLRISPQSFGFQVYGKRFFRNKEFRNYLCLKYTYSAAYRDYRLGNFLNFRFLGKHECNFPTTGQPSTTNKNVLAFSEAASNLYSESGNNVKMKSNKFQKNVMKGTLFAFSQYQQKIIKMFYILWTKQANKKANTLIIWTIHKFPMTEYLRRVSL